MKILFIGKKKKKPEEATKPDLESMVKILAVPKAMIARGVLVNITEDGAEIREHEGEVFSRLDTKIDVRFRPRPASYESPWEIVFDLDYTLEGCCYGSAGPKAVKEVGLKYPTERTPFGGRIELQDDQRAVWQVKARPTAEQIAQVVQEIQRQVRSILADYSRTRAIMSVVKSEAS